MDFALHVYRPTDWNPTPDGRGLKAAALTMSVHPEYCTQARLVVHDAEGTTQIRAETADEIRELGRMIAAVECHPPSFEILLADGMQPFTMPYDKPGARWVRRDQIHRMDLYVVVPDEQPEVPRHAG